MKKTTRKKAPKDAPLIPEPSTVELIPKDLKDLWGAVEAAATAFSVLDKGCWPHSYAAAIKQSLGFLAKLHEQTVAACLKHPQAHMISELKEELTRPKEGVVKDGAQNQTN